MREAPDDNGRDSIKRRGRVDVCRRRYSVVVRAEHEQARRRNRLAPVQPQHEIKQRPRRFHGEVRKRLGQDFRIDRLAEIHGTQCRQNIAGQMRSVEPLHVDQILRLPRHQAARDRSESARRYGCEKRRGANGPRGEQPLDDCRAHRMSDQYRRRRQRCRDVLDVGDIVVEPGDEQRLLTAARAVTTETERVRGKTLRREPWQEKRLPAPRVAKSAVNEKQRRLVSARPRQV